MADLRSYITVNDCDSGGGTDYVQRVNLTLSASGGGIEAIGQQLSAASLPVVLASDQSAVAVNTELPNAAALADNTGNPTVPGVGAFGMAWDGANWDRVPGTSGDGLLVNLGANNDVTITGTVTVDSELPSAASLTDDFANPTAPAVGAFNMVWDGSTWDRLPGTSAAGVLVNTELPAAAALTDNFANPTAPAVGAFAMGWDGANWDRVSVVGGVLQVDVLSGAGSTTPTSPATEYVTSAAIAAGASDDLDSSDSPGKSLAQVTVWSSVSYRARVYLVNNDVEETEPLAVGGGQAFMPWTWAPPHADYATLGSSAGGDLFRVEFVSLDDSNAADAHAVFAFQG